MAMCCVCCGEELEPDAPYEGDEESCRTHYCHGCLSGDSEPCEEAPDA